MILPNHRDQGNKMINSVPAALVAFVQITQIKTSALISSKTSFNNKTQILIELGISEGCRYL